MTLEKFRIPSFSTVALVMQVVSSASAQAKELDNNNSNPFYYLINKTQSQVEAIISTPDHKYKLVWKNGRVQYSRYSLDTDIEFGYFPESLPSLSDIQNDPEKYILRTLLLHETSFVESNYYESLIITPIFKKLRERDFEGLKKLGDRLYNDAKSRGLKYKKMLAITFIDIAQQTGFEIYTTRVSRLISEILADPNLSPEHKEIILKIKARALGGGAK